ncbi:MAG: nitrogen fixation protein NifU [Methylocystis sp.]|uniref:nitrogen fixation protein NifU n=1 Tax=Methylocystis sp. TaxID=1911079 RepID=UPI003D1316AC
MSAEARGRETLEEALARLEMLTAALERVADAQAREATRELIALVLDLHGRAFERLNAIIGASSDGAALIERIVEDQDIRAMLLLHGLHPQHVEQRLRDVVLRMQPQWSARGLQVDLISAGKSFAIVQLRRNGLAEPNDELRLEIENALTDAAPDLDDILIEMDMTEIYAETAA